MAHSPETVEQYVCESCQIVYAGTPVHISAGEHDFDPPESCHACDGDVFVPMQDWIRHHD